MASTAQGAVSASRSIIRSRWRRRPRPGAGKGTLFPRHALGRLGRETDMRYRILMLFPLLALGACGDRQADPRGVEHDEKNGRASWRDSRGQYVYIWVVAVTLKK